MPTKTPPPMSTPDPTPSLPADFVAWVTHADLFNAEIYYLSRIPAKIEWSEVSIIVFWALVMSFVATLPPAWRAARLDPVEALRYE